MGSFLQFNGRTLLSLALAISMSIVLYQTFVIHGLRLQGGSWTRQKRSMSEMEMDGAISYSVDTPPPPFSAENGASEGISHDHPFYFPLYTQLSSKALERICQEKFGISTMQKEVEDGEENRTKPSKSVTQQTKLKHRKMFKEKVCSPIQALGTKQPWSYRMYQKGSAIRRGDQWLLTEFTTGNTLFQFDTMAGRRNNTDVDEEVHVEKEGSKDSTKRLLDFPTAIHTLTESFKGTDHALAGTGSDLVFYYQIVSAISRIQALHLGSGRRISRLLNASKSPLYGHKEDGEDGSSLDLEIDQSALWAIYKQPNETTLTVSKMSPHSLKELEQWHLDQVDGSSLLNAFVSCGVLHTVTRATKLESMSNGRTTDSHWVSVQPVFDFRTSRYLRQEKRAKGGINWLAYGSMSNNVQYDAQSDSLNIYDSGHIYSVPIKRKRFV